MRRPLIIALLAGLWVASSLWAGPIPIHGKVLRPGGAGLAGARVDLVAVVPAHAAGLAELEGRAAEPAATAATAADGSFRLAAPRAGMWMLFARAKGFVPQKLALLPLLDELDLPPARLAPDRGLTVVVRGPDGRPVAGARVQGEVEAPPASAVALGWHPAARVAVTGAKGRARLPCAAAEALAVLAGAPGHPVAQRTGARCGAVEIELPAGRRVELRVVDDAGRPAPGVLVRLAPAGWPLGRTEAGGLLDLVAPAGPPLDLRLSTEDGRRLAVAWIPDGTPDQMPPPVRLPPLSELPSAVVAAANGRPIAGAWTWIDGDPGAVRRTGAGGDAFLAVPPSGEVVVHAAAAGYFPARLAVRERPRLPRQPPALVLGAATSATGVVVDERGRAVAGARVALAAPLTDIADADAGTPSFTASTVGDGRFEVGGLPAAVYDLTVRARGWAPRTVRGVEVAATPRVTDLGTVVLASGVAVEGIVVDHEGRPVAEAEIHVVEAGDEEALLRLDSSSPAALSASDGSFRLEDRRPGETVHLIAERAGFAPATAREVHVPTEAPLRLTLRPASAVSGSVTDADGVPIPGALVVLHRPLTVAGIGGSTVADGRGLRATTDDEGRFRFAGLAPGPVMMGVQADGWLMAARPGVEVPAGRELDGVDFVLEPGATIAGRVRSPSGEPVPGAQVRIADPRSGEWGSMERRVVTDGGGRYAVDGVVPGPRTVTVEHRSHPPAVRQLDVRPGENTFDVTLEAGSEVHGRVVDGSGAPAAGALVVLQGGRLSREAISGPDGAFAFAGVPDGSYELSAEKAGFARASSGTPVALAGAPVAGIELRLSTGGAIAGRLHGLGPEDLVSAQVWTGSVLGRVAPDGTYRIEGLGPGTWTVVGEVPGRGLRAEGSVVLEPGVPEALLDLELGLAPDDAAGDGTP